MAFDVGTLAAGTSQTIYVTTSLSLNANTAQSALNNTAATSGTGLAPVNSNTVATDIVYPKLTKRVRNVTRGTAFGTNGAGYPGDVLEYCLDYNNFSSIVIPAWRITDSIPANTTYISGSATPAAVTFNPAPAGQFGQGQIVYGPIDLAPAASGSVCFSVKVN